VKIKLLVISLLLVAFSTANARAIHYGAASHPELLLCDQMHWRGETDDSNVCYRKLLQTDLPTAVHAEAAWALNELQLANQLFRDAAAMNPDDAAIRVRWGDLFADTHQDGEAMNIYREALQLDSGNAFAMLGAARVLVGGFDDAANTYLEPLLTDATKHDGARAAAWLIVARVSLENSNMPQAMDALDQAEEILDHSEWPPLDLYALRAAADLLDNVSESRYTAMSLEFNPGYGGIYAIPAHFYVITRRYRDAIDMYQKAVDIEPDLSAAHEELGINLLRDNQMSRARKHLEIAYEVDPFSPAAVANHPETAPGRGRCDCAIRAATHAREHCRVHGALRFRVARAGRHRDVPGPRRFCRAHRRHARYRHPRGDLRLRGRDGFTIGPSTGAVSVGHHTLA